MKTREIMTENPRCVTPDTPVRDVARLMREGDFGLVPVVDHDDTRRLEGVISDRDIAVRCVAEGHDGNCRVGDHMTRDTRTAREDEDVEQVMQVMRREQVRRVPVVNDTGRLVGIVAQADLALSADDESAVEKTVERISEPRR